MLLDVIFKSKTSSGDSGKKSFAKAISWRLLGTIDTIIISYVITGEIKSAISIGSIEVFTKIVLYYLHERAWNKFKF